MVIFKYVRSLVSVRNGFFQYVSSQLLMFRKTASFMYTACINMLS